MANKFSKRSIFDVQILNRKSNHKSRTSTYKKGKTLSNPIPLEPFTSMWVSVVG